MEPFTPMHTLLVMVDLVVEEMVRRLETLELQQRPLQQQQTQVLVAVAVQITTQVPLEPLV